MATFIHTRQHVHQTVFPFIYWKVCASEFRRIDFDIGQFLHTNNKQMSSMISCFHQRTASLL